MGDPGDIYDDNSDDNSSEYSSDNNELYCHTFMVVMIWATRKINVMERQAMHNSALQGHDRMLELLYGHPQRLYNRVRMNRNCFERLCLKLEGTQRLRPTRYMSVKEQVLIFLYIVTHAATVRMSMEDWQHSGETISRYFKDVCLAICGMSGEYIRPPDVDDVYPNILHNRKYYPYFKDCIRAIDGTHVNVIVPAHLAPSYRGRNKFTTQQVMASCDFDLKFTYMAAGWEGSMHDAAILRECITNPSYNFRVPPPGKYYLVDCGYANKEGFLGPYRSHKYQINNGRRRHGQGGKENLFNYRHSSLRNSIERTFGIWKNRFPILTSMKKYPLYRQSQIPIACAVLHNFIKMWSNDVNHFSNHNPVVDDEKNEEDEIEEEDVSVDEIGGSSTGGATNNSSWVRFRERLAEWMIANHH